MTIFFAVLSILLLSTTIAASIFCYNLYNQVIQLEDYLNKSVKKEVDIDKFYNYILSTLISAYAEMQRIDKKGSFSGDDEVGFAFKVMYRAIEETTQKIESIRVKDDKSEI